MNIFKIKEHGFGSFYTEPRQLENECIENIIECIISNAFHVSDYFSGHEWEREESFEYVYDDYENIPLIIVDIITTAFKYHPKYVVSDIQVEHTNEIDYFKLSFDISRRISNSEKVSCTEFFGIDTIILN